MILRNKGALLLLILAATLLPALQGCGGKGPASGHLVVGAGSTVEQRLLGELSQIALSEAGYDVELKRDLGNPWMVRKATAAGSVDLMWDYTGRVWLDELGHDQALTDPDDLFRRLRDEEALHGLSWITYAPAEDRTVLVMPETLAAEARLRSISDLDYYLDNVNPDLVLCTTAAINESSYGPAALQRVYTLRFKVANVRAMEAVVAIAGLRDGACDGALVPASAIPAPSADLRALWDNLDLMPASNLAPVVSAATLRDHPELTPYLRRLTAALTRSVIASLSQQIAEGKPAERVARQFLRVNDVVSTPTYTPTPTNTYTPVASPTGPAAAMTPTPATN